MSKPVSPADLVTPKVTTGPIIGSRKTYSAPDAARELRVPIREIVLDPSSGEPPVPVYDPSGPYTESDVAVDLAGGLKPVREAWIEARNFAVTQPRAIKPEDNGNVSADHLAPLCPATRILRAESRANSSPSSNSPAPGSSPKR